jgi:hypothetical protein
MVPGTDETDAGRLFQAALQAFLQLGYPYWVARTVVDWTASRQGGDPPDRVRLSESAGELQRLGATALALRARDLLGPEGG